MHAWHNKFARYLCTLLPFAFILYFVWKNMMLKIFFGISFIAFVIALILSTSRGGYVAFFSMAFVWAVYLSRVRGFNLKKAFVNIILSIFILGTISWALFPPVRERMSKLPEQLSTINQRTQAWLPALDAIKEKPLFGWGYGNRIFHQDEPYKETNYKKAPVIGPENTFIKIMFHQGIIGLIPYVVLILLAIREFWRNTSTRSGIKDYILVACVSVLIGNYILHSMLAVLYMPHLAVILAFGIAATGVNEDSNH
jgi:O-antigen ligase